LAICLSTNDWIKRVLALLDQQAPKGH